MRPDELNSDELTEEFAIDNTAVWPIDDARLEPILLDEPLWIDFDDSPQPDLPVWRWETEIPLCFGFAYADDEEVVELDPERLEEPYDETPPTAPQPRHPTSVAGSFGVHAAVLLALLGWSQPTAEVASQIPVQLVVDEAKPTEPTPPDSNLAPAEMLPKPTAEPAKPQEQIASDTTPPPAPAETKPRVAEASPPPVPRPRPEKPQRVAAAAAAIPHPAAPRPPPPRPRPRVEAPLPLPPPTPVEARLPLPQIPPQQMPQPRPVPIPVAAPAVAAAAAAAVAPMPMSIPAPAIPAWVPSPAPTAVAAIAASPPRAVAAYALPTAPAAVRTPGFDESKGDYYAMLRELTRRHIDLLAASFLGGRRGTTLVRILVMRDGTIARISVAQGSGYPDVDTRIEQMVTAVGRFPPLPAAFTGPSADLQLKLTFPNAIDQ